MSQTPPLPFYATFLPKGRRKKFSADQLVQRLSKKYSDLVAKPVKKGVWSSPSNSIQEFDIKLRAAGVKVQFPIFDIPDPGGDFCVSIEQFAPVDAAAVVAASSEIADALGFSVDLNSLPTWGIEFWAMRDKTPKETAITQSYEGQVKLTRLPLKTWEVACRHASERWCHEANTLRPSSKKKMLKTYGGAEGIADTILREVEAFGKLQSWFECQSGASHENTAILRLAPWSICIRFSGVKNGVLRA